MTRQLGSLDRIDNNQSITYDTHGDFLYHLQNTLLLALREQGRLNTMQCRYAQEKLKQQRMARARNILHPGESG